MAESESRWAPWMRNGRASFLAWVVVLIAYVVGRKLGLNSEDMAPLTNALIGFTGLLIGNLGIAQGQRQARTEREVKQLRNVAAEAHPDMVARDDRITKLEGRADDSVGRETEWSQHQDHKPTGGDDG